jgi:hypothetical protein
MTDTGMDVGTFAASGRTPRKWKVEYLHRGG